MLTDELEAYGMEQLGDQEIENFLAVRQFGVLGLPTGNGPYMVPLSYGYDRDNLYFTYLVGSGSTKDQLSRDAETASFLVYSVESAFSWESVFVTGRLGAVPDGWNELEDVFAGVWRPELLEQARTDAGVRVYKLDVTEQHGVRHAGVPPGMSG